MTEADGIPQSQWQVAICTLTDLPARQMKKSGGISMEKLPNHLRMAADERDRHGHFGAARLLEHWAHLVSQPMEECNLETGTTSNDRQ